MTDNAHIKNDGCLLCAVRQLTEGTPKMWWPENPGEEISGVVLRIGTVPSDFSPTPDPFVDLYLGGSGYKRIRIRAIPMTLRTALENAKPTIGDRLAVRYDQNHAVEKGPRAGTTIKVFTAEVSRGHH